MIAVAGHSGKWRTESAREGERPLKRMRLQAEEPKSSDFQYRGLREGRPAAILVVPGVLWYV